jgi:hypothetical protein
MGAPISDKIACRLTEQACPLASIDPRRLSSPSLHRSLPTTARNLQFPPIDLIRKSRHRSADITCSHRAASEAWPRDITEPALGEGRPGHMRLPVAASGMSQEAPPPSMARPLGRGGAGRASEPPPYYRCRPGRNRGTLRGTVGNAVVACDDPRRFPRMRVVVNCGEHAPHLDDGRISVASASVTANNVCT